jgi:hypothetical protein
MSAKRARRKVRPRPVLLRSCSLTSVTLAHPA